MIVFLAETARTERSFSSKSFVFLKKKETPNGTVSRWTITFCLLDTVRWKRCGEIF
jgi:hypothetical protein